MLFWDTSERIFKSLHSCYLPSSRTFVSGHSTYESNVPNNGDRHRKPRQGILHPPHRLWKCDCYNRKSRNLVLANEWMPLRSFSEAHFKVATDSDSTFLNIACGLGLAVGLGTRVEETLLYRCALSERGRIACLPAVWLCVCAVCALAGRSGKQACGWQPQTFLEETHIISSGLHDLYFITDSLVTVGDGMAATAWLFRAVCTVRCVFMGGRFPSWSGGISLLVLVLSFRNATCLGLDWNGQGPVNPQLYLFPIKSQGQQACHSQSPRPTGFHLVTL